MRTDVGKPETRDEFVRQTTKCRHVTIMPDDNRRARKRGKATKRRRQDDDANANRSFSREPAANDDVMSQNPLRKRSIRKRSDLSASQQQPQQSNELPNCSTDLSGPQRSGSASAVDDRRCSSSTSSRTEKPMSPRNVVDDDADDEVDGVDCGRCVADNVLELETNKFFDVLLLMVRDQLQGQEVVTRRDGTKLGQFDLLARQTSGIEPVAAQEDFDEPDCGLTFSGTSTFLGAANRRPANLQISESHGSFQAAAAGQLVSPMSCDGDTVDGIKFQDLMRENDGQTVDQVDCGPSTFQTRRTTDQLPPTTTTSGLSQEELRKIVSELRSVGDEYNKKFEESNANASLPSARDLLKGVASYETFEKAVNDVIRDDQGVRSMVLLCRLTGEAVTSNVASVGDLLTWTRDYYRRRIAPWVAERRGLEEVVRTSSMSTATSG